MTMIKLTSYGCSNSPVYVHNSAVVSVAEAGKYRVVQLDGGHVLHVQEDLDTILRLLAQ